MVPCRKRLDVAIRCIPVQEKDQLDWSNQPTVQIERSASNRGHPLLTVISFLFAILSGARRLSGDGRGRLQPTKPRGHILAGANGSVTLRGTHRMEVPNPPVCGGRLCCK